ncbi:YceI family protein [Jannaschia marina]|uniref:YceI family protein n=1 Tax=Jannaschia marina TaxID=2741674 RepID=UPI0015CEA684|nr:YceI family protein [Jannaschia marina]
MRTLILTTSLALMTSPAFAGWALDGDKSTMGFVTIKNGETSEAHSFSGLSGSVADDGTAEVSIPLASVETFIDIRNERMREFLFKVADFPAATVSAAIDMAAYEDLAIGDRTTTEIDVTVATNGTEADYFGDISVTRISDTMVEVATTRPFIADARDFDYEDGVAKLRELASLDSIAPSVPVTFNLIFTK